MGWSIKLGRVAGIPVQMHLTFLLLLVWVGMSHWQRDGTSQAVVTGIAFILALFGCVLLHELGHALMARKYGIETKDITLLPIGGVARLEKMPDEPKQELWVALAGPAVNVVIAALLFVWLQIAGGWEPLAHLSVSEGSFVERLLIVNLFLVGFNLLPAFPMDGGRVLRAVLAMKMDYGRATQTAAGIGQLMALVFGFMGLFGNPFLLFIALFVWIGAAQEASLVQVKSALADVPVARAMQTNFKVLSSADTLARVTELLLEGAQQDFPVVWGSEVIGILTRTDLMLALAQRGLETRVADVMRRDFCTANASEMLEPVFARLGQEQCRTMPVLRDGQLAGLLTLENVGEFVMIQAALRSKTPASPPQV
ncbi:MAG TPA: site-2 protease family protein [Abditibacteriaceae bacterium]|nr:site-2 protease family protein [Abditibacteriaceae bacterium]